MRLVLFVLTIATAAALLLAILLTPWFDAGDPRPHGLLRLLAVFSRDGAVRKTALAAALGLVVTACVFFQPSAGNRPRRRPPRRPPPGRVAGA